MVNGDLAKLSKKDDGGIILTVYHLQGVFAIFGGGLVFATVVFIGELLLAIKTVKK